MTPVQLVVTDLAGTTVEDPGLVLGAFRAGLAAVDAHGVTDAQLTALMGVDKREAFATLLGLAQDDAAVDAALEVFVARTVSDAAAGRYAPLPGVDRALRALEEAGVKVVFTTGFGREILDGILNANDWRGLAAASVASDEVPHGRPAADIVHEAMRRVGVHDAAAVAVVGDTLSDLGCAKAADAGWAIAVTSGSGDPQELAAAPGAIVVEGFEDAVTMLLERSAVV